jgi:hypothetical protein
MQNAACDMPQVLQGCGHAWACWLHCGHLDGAEDLAPALQGVPRRRRRHPHLRRRPQQRLDARLGAGDCLHMGPTLGCKANPPGAAQQSHSSACKPVLAPITACRQNPPCAAQINAIKFAGLGILVAIHCLRRGSRDPHLTRARRPHPRPWLSVPLAADKHSSVWVGWCMQVSAA